MQLIALYPVHFSSGKILLVSAVIRRKTKEVHQPFDTPHFIQG